MAKPKENVLHCKIEIKRKRTVKKFNEKKSFAFFNFFREFSGNPENY